MTRILLFDSGIGGLSIANEIRTRLPAHPLVYVADNRNFPYGTLPEEVLIERVIRLFPNLIAQFQPGIIIIGCNSASTLVLDRLRALTSIPIIGVVPAIKPAAKLTRTGHIGLLATPGTVQRTYTQKLIRDFADNCIVTKVGSSALVEEAEKKLRESGVDQARIADALQAFVEDPEVDVLVLGCTHFPFLKNEIQAALAQLPFRRPIQLIDSAQAIAKRACFLLTNFSNNAASENSVYHALSNSSDHPDAATKTPSHRFFFTKEQPEASQLMPHLLRHGFVEADFLDY